MVGFSWQNNHTILPITYQGWDVAWVSSVPGEADFVSSLENRGDLWRSYAACSRLCKCTSPLAQAGVGSPFSQHLLPTAAIYHVEEVSAFHDGDYCRRTGNGVLCHRVLREYQGTSGDITGGDRPEFGRYSAQTQTLGFPEDEHRVRGMAPRTLVASRPFIDYVAQYSLRGRWPSERYQKILDLQMWVPRGFLSSAAIDF